jgi:hypothetical protein
MPVVDFRLKIGMFPRMKTDNVALQLSEKCMTRMAVWQGKIQVLMDFTQLRTFSPDDFTIDASLASNHTSASANLMEYRP